MNDHRQYHLGVVAAPDSCPGTKGVAVLLFQDPERLHVSEHIIVRVDESLVLEAPDLPPPPVCPRKRSSDGRAEKEWLLDQIWYDFELTVPETEWVSVHFAKCRKPEEKELKDFYVLGRLLEVQPKGFYRVKIIGRSKEVVVSRAQLRPLFQGHVVVYTKTHTPVWPAPLDESKTNAQRAKSTLFKPATQWPKRTEPVGGRTMVKAGDNGFYTQSGVTDIMDMKKFDSGSQTNPTVDGFIGNRSGTPGRLDASSDRYLLVFTPRKGFQYMEHEIKVLIHPDVRVTWHASGLEGRQIRITNGEQLLFTVATADEAAMARIVRCIRRKMVNAQKTPQRYVENDGKVHADVKMKAE